jgi:hypothetical protein
MIKIYPMKKSLVSFFIVMVAMGIYSNGYLLNRYYTSMTCFGIATN